MIDLFSSGVGLCGSFSLLNLCCFHCYRTFLDVTEKIGFPKVYLDKFIILLIGIPWMITKERVFSELSSLGSLLITAHQFRDSPRQILESKLEEKSVEIKFRNRS